MQKTKRYFSLSNIFSGSFYVGGHDHIEKNLKTKSSLEELKGKQIFLFVITLFIAMFVQANSAKAAFFISPGGVDSPDCSISSPCRTFSHVFSQMSAGDELVLLDGTYSEANETGYISYLGTNSAQAPSGIDRDSMTILRAQNPDSVVIEGKLFVGRSIRKDSYIKFQGITFEGGGTLYNTDHIYIKDCGFNGGLGVGTNDHENGNTYNLIEDSWVWAEGNRGIAANYRADYNVWRRVVIRGDGCDKSGCAGSGNPNIGFTVYNSREVSVQNVINVDRILNGGTPYGDFASAQHDSSEPETPLENNEWLGCISVNSEDTAFHLEADNTVSPSHYLKNCIAITKNPIIAAFNMNYDLDATIENATAWIDSATSAIMLYTRGQGSTGQITRNLLAKGNTSHYGVNRGGETSYVNVFGTFRNSKYSHTTVTEGDITSDPQADGVIPSLQYPTRIEEGSTLKGGGYNGQDIGANVVKRYGVEGTFHGETGYNTLTNEDLWPWPNENIIKTQMAADSNRGFVRYSSPFGSPNTLTSYIWEYLGNEIPCDIYSTCDNAGNSNSGLCFIGSILNDGGFL